MGILDEAIREHLELKRQHGADESELKGLEDSAFGEAERPDAAGPSAGSEAETQIISPGSSITSPAGEGDQLDKVFEATRQREAEAEAQAAKEAQVADSAAPAEAPASPDATFAEHPIPDPPAPAAAVADDPPPAPPPPWPTDDPGGLDPAAPAAPVAPPVAPEGDQRTAG